MLKTTPQNSAIGNHREWEENGFRFIEMCRQEYGGNNCVFSAGLIENHPIEQAYLKWEKDGDRGGMLMLRADELAAIAWVANGAIWGGLYNQFEKKEDEES